MNRRATTSYLTRKLFLTNISSVVGNPVRRDASGAMSHPARRGILHLLIESDRSVNTVAGHFPMNRPALSQYLRILMDAGLLTQQWLGRERRYRLVPAPPSPVRA
jgi:DNA-binding transcriptional ArsR family regulator